MDTDAQYLQDIIQHTLRLTHRSGFHPERSNVATTGRIRETLQLMPQLMMRRGPTARPGTVNALEHETPRPVPGCGHMHHACSVADAATVAESVPYCAVERSGLRGIYSPARDDAAAGSGQPPQMHDASVKPTAAVARGGRAAGPHLAPINHANRYAAAPGRQNVRDGRGMTGAARRVAPLHSPPQRVTGLPPLDSTASSFQAFSAPSVPDRSAWPNSQGAAGRPTGLPLLLSHALQPHAGARERSSPNFPADAYISSAADG